MIIWTNVAIFVALAVVWSMFICKFFPHNKVWIDIIAGMIMMVVLITLGFPMVQ